MNDFVTTRFFLTTRKKIFNRLLLLALFFMSLTAHALTYYSVASGHPGTTSNWNTSRNGSGSAPSGFATSGDIFIIQGTGGGSGAPHIMTSTNTFTFGAGVTLEVESGATLQQNSNITFNATATFKLNAGSTFIQNASGFATISAGIENWSSSATINYINLGFIPTANITGGAHPNVTISANGNRNLAGVITNISGNLVINSGTNTVTLTGSVAMSLTVGGNIDIQSTGAFSLGNGTVSPTLNLGGNLNVISSGTFTYTGSGTASVNFTKSGTQILTNAGTMSGRINYNVNNNSILDVSTSLVSGTGAFTVASGGGLITANSAGIAATGATGSVQVTGTRTFNTAANYTFNGSSAQVTGTGFTGANNLTINNSAGVSLSAAASVTGTLTLTSGNLTLGNNNLTLAQANAVGGTPSVSNHIVTDGTGLLQSTYGSGLSYTFPTGFNATNYNPVTITNNGAGSQTYTINADAISPSLTNSIKASWSIGGVTASSATIAFPWNSTNDVSATAPTTGVVYNLISGTWTSQGGSTSGTAPNYTTTLTGVSSSNPSVWTVAMPAVTPSVVISSNSPAAGNIIKTSSNNIIYGAQIVVSTADASLTGLTVNTTGTDTYAESSATDLTNFILWINTTNSLSGATQLGSTITNAPALGGALAFTSGSNLPRAVNTTIGTYYLFVTCDVASGATPGRIITIAPTSFSNITFASANKTGTDPVAAGNTQTIIAAPTVTTGSATDTGTSTVILNGTVSANAASTTNSFVYSTDNSYNLSVSASPSTTTAQSVAISASLSSLPTNTLYNFKAQGVNSVSTVIGSAAQFTTLSTAPTVGAGNTETAVGFTANWTAPTNDGSETYTYTVEVSTNNSSQANFTTNIIVGVTQSGIASSTLNAVIIGLSSGTTYYYRVKAVNAGGSSDYSSISAGVTTTSAVVPTVTTASISAVSQTTATGGGNVTLDGGDAITDRGLVFNTSSPAETGGTIASEGGSTTGVFTKGLTGLSNDTTYYVKAYATNGVGTSYGSEASFTTLVAEPTQQATSVTFGTRTTTSLVVNFSGGNGGRRIVVVRPASAVNFAPTDGVSPSGVNTDYSSATNQGNNNKIVYDGTGSSVTVSGLTANATYHVAVYEYNNNSVGVPNYYPTAATANQATYNPTITTTGTLSAFANTVTGNNSASQSYTVSAVELSSSVTITAPTGFAISLDDTDYSVNPIVLTKDGSDAVPSTTIYVRFSPASANGANSGIITHGATGAITQNVAVSGNAIATEPSSNGSISFGTTTANSIVVDLPTVGDGSNRIIVVKAGSAVDATPTDGTSYTANATFASGSQLGTGNYVVYDGTGSGSSLLTLTGLIGGTTYHFAVFEYNVGTGASQNYFSTGAATASQTTNVASNASDAYRTAATGNWNNTSTWESFTNGSWMAATLTPDNNASSITIRNGYSVTVTASVTAYQLIVNNGGTLIIGSGATLTIANGAGTDLIVDAGTGTPAYPGDPSIPGGILQIANGGLLATANNATVIINGTIDDLTSVATAAYTFTAYTAGTNTTMTINGTFKISGLGAGNNAQIGALSTGVTITAPSLPGTVGGTLYIASGVPRLAATNTGNLVWNSTTGNSNSILNTNPTSITGDYIVVGTGSATINHGSGGSARALNISGNFTMLGGTYHFNASGGTGAQNVTVNGNANISGGTLLLSNATGGSSLFTVRGNLLHTGGTFGCGTSITVGTLSMASTTVDQTISTTGFNNQVNLTVNNTKLGGGTVTINNAITTGSVTLTAGTLAGATNLNVLTGTTVTRTAGSLSGGSPTYGAAVNVTYNGISSVASGSELSPVSGGIGALTVNNSTGTYTLSNAVTVTSVAITAGILDVSASNYNISVSGNWVNSGTFNPRNGTVTFNGTSTISGSTASVFKNITVAASSSLSTPAISIAGNLLNNNSFTASAPITFNGTDNQTISGSGSTTVFTTIVLNNTGTFPTNDILEVTSSSFTASASFLTLTAGILKFSGSATFSNAFLAPAAYTIPASTGIWLNNSSVNVLGQNGSPSISGLLRITSGSYTVGTSTGQSMTSGANGAAITIEGGTFTVQGRLGLSHVVNYSQSGGTVLVANTGSSSSSIASFDISNSSSTFTMSSGTINLVQANANAANLDFRVAASTVSISGGTLNIGTSSSSASSTYGVQGSMPNVVVDNTTNTKQADIIGQSTINGNLTINSGSTLTSSSQTFSITGNWSNSGTFTNTGSTVTFNGIGNQTVTKNGGETFNNFSNTNTTGTVSAANNITVGGTFTTSAGSILDMGTNALVVSTVANSGTLKTQNTGSTPFTANKTWGGTVEFNSTGAQTLATATFNNLNVKNGSTLTLTGNVTINGSMLISDIGTNLTINPNVILTIAGTADFGGKSVTLKSDSSGTAAIGQVTGSLTGATNVTVERYIPAKRAWRALTAPLKGSNTTLYASWQNAGVSASPFNTGVELWGPSGTGMATGPAYNIRQYTTSGWTDITNTQSTNLFTSSANNAYMVFVTGGYGSNNIGNGQSAATTLKATGQLITGTVTVPVTSVRHTLVGNPFASPLSPSAILAGNTQANLYTNIWMWDPAISTNGAYVNYDASINSGTFSDNSGSYASSSAAIQSGQAFFVRAVSGTDSLTLSESMKSSSISNTFRNNNSIAASVFRIGFAKQMGITWMPLDGAVAAFYDAANPAVDPADGTKMVNSAENMALVRGTTNLSIEHYPLVNATDQLNVKIWNTQQARYKLKLNTEEFTMVGVEAWLQDLYTGTSQQLNLDGSVQEYEFDVDPTVSASSGTRFRIVFTNTALAVDIPTQGQLSIYPNPATGGKVTVSLPSGTFEGCSYELINVLGQVVRQDEIANGNNAQALIPITGLPNSWYALRILKENKVVYQGKLIIKN